MNVVLESAFDRLLTKYERTFGEPPPFTAATAEEVIAYMRRRLREATTTEDASGPAGWLASAAQDADGAATHVRSA